MASLQDSMSDLPNPWLDETFHKLGSPSVKVREAVVTDILLPALQSDDIEKTSDDFVTLCRILLLANIKYNTRQMRLLVAKVINFACSYEPIQKNFIIAYINVLAEMAKIYLPNKKNPKPSFSLESYYMFFALITSLLENHFDICKSIQKHQWIIQAQLATIKYLEAYSPTEKKARSPTSRSICKTFIRSLSQTTDEHWRIYIDLFENDKTSSICSTAIGIFASASHQHEGQCKEKFLDVYQKILLSPNAPSDLTLFAFSRFLAGLSEEEASDLLPVIKRAFARNPKAATSTGLNAFINLKLNASALPEIFEILKPALKLEIENILKPTTRLIITLLGTTSNRQVAIETVKQIATFAGDRSLKEICRIHVLLMLERLVTYPEASSQVSVSLVSIFKTSNTNPLKEASLSALTAWLQVAEELPASVRDLYATCSQPTNRRILLKSLSGALFNNKIRQGALPIFPEILKSISKPPKAVERYDFTLALICATLLASGDEEKSKKLDSIIEQFLSPEKSFLFSNDFLKMLAEGQLEGIIDVCFVLLQERPILPTGMKERLTLLLCSFLVKPNQKLQYYAMNYIIRLSNAIEGLCELFLRTIDEFLLSDNALKQRTSSRSLRHIIRSVIKRVDVPVDIYPSLILLIAHPHITPKQQEIRLFWASLELVQPTGSQHEFFNQVINAIVTRGVSTVRVPFYQAAAIRAAQFFVHEFQTSVCPFVTRLIEGIEGARVQDFSSREIEIYRTPEGELYDTSITEKKYQSRGQTKAAEPSTSKKTQSQGRPSQQTSKRGPNKKGKPQGPTKEQIEQEKIAKQLQAEQSIRETVSQRAIQTNVFFDLLTSIFQANGKLVTPEDFARISDLVLLLLNHTLVRQSVAQCHRALSKSTSFMSTFGQQIGVLIQQIFDESDHAIPYHELSDSLVNILSKVLALATTQLLDVSSFIYVTPLIETGLLRPTTFRVQQNAMKLFELHAESSYPPGRPLTALLKAIDAKMMPERAEQCVVKFSECDLGYFPQPLLDGCYSDSAEVRHACVSGIVELDALDDATLANLQISTTLWFIQHDGVTANHDIAEEIWSIYEQPIFDDFSLLYKLFAHPSLFVRGTNGRALAQAVIANQKNNSEISKTTLTTLMNLYAEYLPPEPVMGVRGLEFAEDVAYIQRQGVAIALENYYPAMDSSDVLRFYEFLCGSPLIDGDEVVRQAMIRAGIHVAEYFGEEKHELMLSHFEKCLAEASHAVSGTLLREAIVLFLGSLAKKFDLGMTKTCVIVERLIEALETPSQQVQQTVSECLSPLMKPIKAELPKYIDLLFNKLQQSKETHERKGAAFGIAAIGKGLGVPGLSQFQIMDRLKEMLENKRSIPAREGGLFAFEALSKRMKRGFEASAISKLENLLNCCGDNSPAVRDAATSASRAIMSELSNHGVKRVVPALVKALGDRAWRTQTSAAELLGSMAFCAPKQLSACLPEIVPPLVDSLASTHIEVQKCSRKALGHIASVVRNPEIQSHIPILLKALDNPTVHLEDALSKLIKTNYVHVIDAPSLALLMPILQRGLHSSRTTSTKKKAAQIIGNMTKLADHKDLVPYLSILVPALQNTLIDLIPETRSVSAAAFGYLVKGLGEERFPDLVDNLYAQLRSQDAGIVHSGAAQGLALVFSSLDIQRFESFLPIMLVNANDSDPSIRGGAITFFVFVPGAFGKRLEVYLPRILPAVLQGLADESEYVREASLRAGQAIIAEYGATSLDILLPLLEGGLFHSNYRIRLSSVTLLSDLLNKITGADVMEEEGVSQDVAESGKILASVLGEEKLFSVLSALYLCRSDNVRAVQQQALLTWKAAVLNTQSTLRKILPMLLQRIINCLGSSNEDKRHVGSKTLGDLVQKLPEMILPTIVPIIETGLHNESLDTRLGVCLGLAEIVTFSRRHVLGSYLDRIIPCVRFALCDPEEEVREAATKTFDSLFKASGSRVIDEILPKLLEDIHDNESSNALHGLRDILGVRAKVILPHLVPYLLTEPITSSKCNALISMAEVSGTNLYSHMSMIFTRLLPLLHVQPEILDILEAVVVSVKKEGIHILLSDILKLTKSTEPLHHQRGAAEMIQILASKSSTDYSSFTSQLIGEMLNNFNHHNEEIREVSLRALDSLVKRIHKDNLANYVPELERQLRAYLQAFAQEGVDVETKYLPGFSLPKGLSPLLKITLEGVRFGNPNVRETSAVCLGQMIKLTDPSCMRPYVALITGPLIRVMGDRFSEPVKTAILNTMGLLLDNCGALCKPFVNQLQTTFIRSLNDPSEKVRASAALNLGKLMVLSTRIDQLVTELLNTLATCDTERKETLLVAISNVLSSSGDRVSEKILINCEEKCVSFMYDSSCDGTALSAVGNALAQCYRYLSEDRFDEFFGRLLTFSDTYAQSCVLNSLLEFSPSQFSSSDRQKQVMKLIGNFISSKDEKIRLHGAVAIRKILDENESFWKAQQDELCAYWASLLSDSVSGIKIQVLDSLKKFSKESPEESQKYLKLFVPILMERVKDRSSLPVKLAAERTLYYVLQVRTNPSLLDEYTALVGQAQARPVLDYCKRVLSKLTDDDVE